MTAIEYLDRPQSGWFPLDVMRRSKGSSLDWVALMIDVDPDDFKNCPTACRPRQRWLIIAGKHSDRNAAWDALEDMMSTRH
jgi:hypothetical protein